MFQVDKQVVLSSYCYIAFIAVAMCGIVITACISRWGKKRHSTEATPNTQEELLLDLTYEEVDVPQSQTIRLEKNVAYVPVKQSQRIQNAAHGPVKRN